MQSWHHVNKRDWYLFRRRVLSTIPDAKLCCYYCEKKLSNHKRASERIKATLDHLLPITRGGEVFDEKNLVVACLPCNQSKSGLTEAEFIHSF